MANQKRQLHGRKLEVRFRWDTNYNEAVVNLCRLFGTIKVTEPNFGELETYGSIILTLKKGLSREKIIDTLFEQQPPTISRITTL